MGVSTVYCLQRDRQTTAPISEAVGSSGRCVVYNDPKTILLLPMTQNRLNRTSLLLIDCWARHDHTKLVTSQHCRQFIHQGMHTLSRYSRHCIYRQLDLTKKIWKRTAWNSANMAPSQVSPERRSIRSFASHGNMIGNPEILCGSTATNEPLSGIRRKLVPPRT